MTKKEQLRAFLMYVMFEGGQRLVFLKIETPVNSEVIAVKNEDALQKWYYIMDAYDNDLCLRNNKNVKITGYEAGEVTELNRLL